MAVKTFVDGVSLPASDINTYLSNSGLVYVKSQTVGAGVSSVTVTGAFSSDYDDYRIIYNGGTMTAGDTISMKLGTTAIAGYFGSYIYAAYTAGAPSSAGNNNTAYWSWVGGGGADNATLCCDLFGPNVAKTTRIVAGPIHYSTIFGTYTGVDTSTTQHTSFQFIAGSGTITGGTIYVYGYRKA